MRVHVDILDDKKAFLEEWERIYAVSDAAFFLSPAWIETAMALAPASTAFSGVRIFDDLRGVYGLALVGTKSAPSLFRPHEARLNESGSEAFDRIYLEYNDFLLAKTASPEARLEAICAIIEAMPRADEFVFRNARPPLVAAVVAAAERAGLGWRTLLRQPTYAINLSQPVLDGFSSALRAKIKRSMRRYEERGALRLDRPQSEEERAVAWTELMRLHAQTWQRRGMKGVFGAADFSAFHLRLIEEHPDKTDLLRLSAGDETIGILYNFTDQTRAYNYQSGFLYESNNQLAPGFVAHALAAEHYRERGLQLYDLMGGDADYKRRLGVEGETLHSIALVRDTVKTRLRATLASALRGPAAGTHQT